MDVSDGKIVRVRPMHFDWKYPRDSFRSWKFQRDGHTLESNYKGMPSPWSLSYKKRTYSPNRIQYPMKRVDFDPNGERNPQNRGKSKYVRISWDEATDLIATEVKRIIATYGPLAILAQGDGHGECKTINTPHGHQARLLEMLGGFTQQVRNPDSWEGFYWGSKHVWGQGIVGMMDPSDNCMKDITENSEMVLFWGCDPETTPWGFVGQFASRLCYFWTECGIKQVYVCPDLNYGAAVHADKWIPVWPNTDSALQLAIIYTWLKEDTWDKEYVKTHAVGMEQVTAYVVGDEDGIPKTPEWASEKCGVPEWTIKALARDMAAKVHSWAHYFGGSYARGPYSHEPARLECIMLGMQGLGAPGRPSGPDLLRRHAAAGTDPQHALLQPAAFRAPHQAHPDHHPGLGQAAHPQDPHPQGHPRSASGLLRQRRHRRAGLRPVRQVRVPHRQGEGRHRDPHDVDRHPLPDHLLELRQRDHHGRAQSQDRVHRGAAPLAGERLSLRRRHPAYQHQHGSRRHRHQHPAGNAAPQRHPPSQGHRPGGRIEERLRSRPRGSQEAGQGRGVQRGQDPSETCSKRSSTT